MIRFERPGAQATVAEDGADAEPKTPAVADADAAWGASLGKLGKSKRKAMELAAANGTVSTGALVGSAQITRRAASAALKRLSERGAARVGRQERARPRPVLPAFRTTIVSSRSYCEVLPGYCEVLPSSRLAPRLFCRSRSRVKPPRASTVYQLPIWQAATKMGMPSIDAPNGAASYARKARIERIQSRENHLL